MDMRSKQYWSVDYIKECRMLAHGEAHAFANWASVGSDNKSQAFVDSYRMVFEAVYAALTAIPKDG